MSTGGAGTGGDVHHGAGATAPAGGAAAARVERVTPILPRYTLGARNPLWWGMISLIAIEIVVFGGLLFAYFWLKLVNPAWPPEGIPTKPLLLPSINTVILIVSGAAMVYALRAVRRGNQIGLKVGQGLAILLGLAFFTLKIVEYGGYDYDWSTHAYGSITWTMTGFHSAHVISVVFKGFIVLGMALKGMFTPNRHLAFELSTLYWGFVVVIWLPLFFAMYISPHL